MLIALDLNRIIRRRSSDGVAEKTNKDVDFRVHWRRMSHWTRPEKHHFEPIRISVKIPTIKFPRGPAEPVCQ